MRFQTKITLALLLLLLPTSLYAGPIYFLSPKTNDTTALLFDKIQGAFPERDLILVNLASTESLKKDGAFYIAAGNRALERVLEEQIKGPVLSVLVSRVAYHQVLESFPEADTGKYLPVYADPSLEHQFALIKALFGKKYDIGVMLSSKTLYMQRNINAVARKLELYVDIGIYKRPLSNRHVIRRFKPYDDVNIILALPDSTIYNEETIRGVIAKAYRENQFIIGYSKALVAAGGLATVYYDIDHTARSATKALEHYFNTKTLTLPDLRGNFGVEINRHVADTYELDIDFTEKVHEKIITILEECCGQ